MFTVTPSDSRRWVAADARASEPDTWNFRLCSTSAMPHMPAPPRPTDWTRLPQLRMRRLQAQPRHGLGGVGDGAAARGARHARQQLAVFGQLAQAVAEPRRRE